MPAIERTTDVIEIHWENAFIYGGMGLLCFFGAWFFNRYGNPTLALVLLIIGLVLFGYGAKRAYQVRHVKGYGYTCPYCSETNILTEECTDDFSCEKCHRMIPVKDGEILDVHTVSCNYCKSVNYYSDKTEVLVCEECAHEIPISFDDDGTRERKQLPKFYAVKEDNSLYELVLTDRGNDIEDLIGCLQHMLALNRNQVKQILEELPATLMTGIPRMKAEMLSAQLSLHNGVADIRSLD